MTTDASPSPLDAPPAAPVPGPSRPRTGRVFGVISAVVGIVLFVIHLTVRTAGVGLYAAQSDPGVGPTVAGVFGLLSIVPIAFVIVFGHLAIARARRAQGVGAAWGGLGLGFGYVLLALWVNRLILAAVASSVEGTFENFVANTFWWA